MKNVVCRSYFNVPIYDVQVLVVVARDAVKAERRYTTRFGNEAPGDFNAFCVQHGPRFGLFFHAGTISAELIGHEISHAVDFIFDYIGSGCRKCDEPRAYLNGYLHKRINALLRKHKIVIHRN